MPIDPTPSPSAIRKAEAAARPNVARVFKGDIEVGVIRQERGHVEFQYHAAWIESGGEPISASLPITTAAITAGGNQVPPYFSALLPEGARLEALAAIAGVDPTDEFTLLSLVGRECIGDVRILPDGQDIATVAPLVDVDRDWSRTRFRDVLLAAAASERYALPGTQPKASAVSAIPSSVAGAMHILKFNTPKFPNIVQNEYLLIQQARAAGLTTVTAKLVNDADGNVGLLVSRFDRARDPETGDVIRLACEDATQVLGIRPDDKYKAMFDDVVTALSERCDDPRAARTELFRQFVFSWLSGNCDLHAKNMSILTDRKGRTKVAPAYDIPSTVVYIPDGASALPFDFKPGSVEQPGKRRPNYSRKKLLQVAERIDVDRDVAERIIDQTLRVTTALRANPDFLDLLSPLGPKRTTDVLSALAQREQYVVGQNLGGPVAAPLGRTSQITIETSGR